jgi:hypothetical protein
MDSLVSQLESQQELGHLLVLEGQLPPQLLAEVVKKFSSFLFLDQPAAWLRPGQLEA